MRLPRIRAVLPRLPSLRRRAPQDRVLYAPRANGRADPGEVVWAWVPFEEDPTQGKDRPVLVIGRRGRSLLTLMLTSKDHARPGVAPRPGTTRQWMDVGTGAWDRLRRPSEVRLDRLIVLRQRDVRREGAALPRDTFDRVVTAARAHHDL